jgi:ABC-2 type transport system ATP-binding protein
MSAVAIKTERLAKEYLVGSFRKRRVLALQGLDLTIEPGQVFGLLGPNGAGKSTTIKLLLNLIRPTRGSASLFGQAPSSAEARRLVGYLPENPAPYEYLTGVEFVTLGAQLAGEPAAGLAKRVDDTIERVGMTQARDLQIRRYSKGMIQRISLASALVSDPKLLVLDEPTSGLDVLGRQLIRDVIVEQRKRGTTVLFCSHIIPDVEALCDRVAVLIGGALVKEGKVVELLKQDDAQMEATVEGLPAEALERLRPTLTSSDPLEGRHLLRFEQHRSAEVLRAVLDAGGQLTQLRRTRFSLEDLFIKALQESGRGVGSQIS